MKKIEKNKFFKIAFNFFLNKKKKIKNKEKFIFKKLKKKMIFFRKNI
jgi:hypothetical protein